MRKWFESSTATRLDVLVSDPEVTCFLCYNDGLFITLENLKVTRLASPSTELSASGSSVKVVTDAVGKPSIFHLFASPVEDASENFYSFFTMASDELVQADMQNGSSLKAYLTRLTPDK